MKNLLVSFVCGGFLILPVLCFARPLHIIHTNDLHSYFKGYKDGRGGYAKLKVKIEELRSESERKGIEVLQLDGGDFGEGTSFFLSQEGVASVKALGMLGTDVSVIGNHDHMLGGKTLGEQIRRAGVPTKFLSANLVQTPEMNLGQVVKPHVDLNKGGISLRIIGLSTAEPHFQYPLLPGYILPPVQVGVEEANKARSEGKELIIALTHIGQKKDVELAKKSSEVDLIIGGHSHDRLEDVRWVTNKKNKQVPIVQAGSHGLVVGSLMIDLSDEGELSVVDYKLHEISEEVTEDDTMASFVAEAAEDRNQYFDGRWEEVVGESLIPLSGARDGKNHPSGSCWGEHMAKMAREAVNADLAIHLAQFEGHSVDPGVLKLGDLIDNFPHFRNYGDKGWEVSTITVNGKALKILLKAIINLRDLGVNFYGATYRVIRIPTFIPFIGGKQWAYWVRINGKRISNDETYTIAFPSEVGHALKETVPPVAKKVFPNLADSGKYYWEVMEDYVRRNSPVKCLSEVQDLPALGPGDEI